MSEFIVFLHQVFQDFRLIRPRKMFDGYGVYHGGIMISLVAEDALYLKAEATTKGYFIKKQLKSF